MSTVCETCRKPEASVECPLCQNSICEDCVLAPAPGAFSLLPVIPKKLAHTKYCRFCFDEHVEPEFVKYQETLEKAENVFVFFTTQRKEIPLIRKVRDLLEVTDCPDRDETILRLAYMAAAKDFNAVIQVEVEHEKIRNHAFQKTRWKGRGFPALVDEKKLDRQSRANEIYR